MLHGRDAMELGQTLLDRLGQDYGFVLYVVDQRGSVNQLSNMLLDEIYVLLCQQVENYEMDHEGAGHA